jgi:hypothetical protein
MIFYQKIKPRNKLKADMDDRAIARILIKDNEGSAYRICSFYHGKDKYKDPYLKFLFPDFSKLPMVRKDLKHLSTDRFSAGLDQISFHYGTGVSTFKNKNNYYDKRKTMAIGEMGFLPLFTLIIFNLSAFNKFNISKKTGNDLEIVKPWRKTRLLTFYLTTVKTSPVLLEGLTLLDTYLSQTKEVGASLVLFDCFADNLPPPENESPIRIISADNVVQRTLVKSAPPNLTD